MTNSHKILLQPCFVLHRRPYRETSAIVELFTLEFGRVAVVAKGIRSKRSSTQSVLEPFMPVLVSWQGKGELPTMTGAESNGQPFVLSGSNLLSGFYINELLLRLLHKSEPFPELYHHYALAIENLTKQENAEIVLRLFEKALLENLGYALTLNYDVDSGIPVTSENYYHYIPEHGPVQVNVATSSGLVIKGQSLLDLECGDLSNAQSRQDAKKLMRTALKPLLGNTPLRSRELFREMASVQKVVQSD